MKVIISYPYSGALYWWFGQEREFALPKTPQHSYYAALFGDVDRHLDVALTSALVYEEFLIPAADAAYPGLGNLQHHSPADLGLEVSEWDPIQIAQKLTIPLNEYWQEDPVLGQLLAGKDEVDVHMELMYAIADALLAAEHRVPVLCSDGRRATVQRLIELGVVPVEPEIVDQFRRGNAAGQMVDSYAQVTGLTFGTDGIREFVDLKEASPLREYAQGFQRALASPGTASEHDFYEAIAVAMESKQVAEQVRGTFEATSRVMSVLGLIPGVGTVTGLADLGSDAAAATAQARADGLSWFELSQTVAGARNRAAIEAKLRALGIRG